MKHVNQIWYLSVALKQSAHITSIPIQATLSSAVSDGRMRCTCWLGAIWQTLLVILHHLLMHPAKVFLIYIVHYLISCNKIYFNQFLAPYLTISPHLTTTTTPNHFITTFLQHCSPRLSQEWWTQTINYLHILHCENKNCGKSIFLFSIYLQSTMNLNLPTPSTCQMMMDLNNHLQCHLAPNFTSHCHGTTSLLSFLVFVCPPPHLRHLPTPSDLVCCRRDIGSL